MKLLVSIFLIIFSLKSYSQYKFELNCLTPKTLNNKTLFFVLWDNYSLNRYKKQDTILIKNNSFFIKGILSKPSEQAYILLKDDSGICFFVVDSGKNDMIIHSIPAESITKKNKLSNTEVINSNSNLLKKKLDYLSYKNFMETQKKSIRSNDTVIKRYRNLRLQELNLLRQFPNTYYSLIYLYSISYSVFSLKPDELLDIYNILDNSIKNSQLGIELKEKLLNYSSLEVGNFIKAFEATTITGLNFTNKLLKDTVYILAFGATWCKPCRNNLSMLKEIYRKFYGQKFEIVDVNLDGNEKAWKAEIINNHLNWINISDNKKWSKSELVKDFSISAIPLYLIIDNDGKIIYNSTGSQNFEYKKIENIISQLLD